MQRVLNAFKINKELEILISLEGITFGYIIDKNEYNV